MCKYTLRLSNRKLLEAQGCACCPDSSHDFFFFFLPEILRYCDRPKFSSQKRVSPWLLSPEEKELMEPLRSWR